ncbi:MAG: hypothetical protein ACK47B_16540 [Armatimonadota bacterium]
MATLELMVEIRRLVDDGFPPAVECAFADAAGREWRFIGKCIDFTSDILTLDSSFPQPGSLACELVSVHVDDEDQPRVEIDTAFPWYTEAVDGETRFVVRPEQLEGLEAAVDQQRRWREYLAIHSALLVRAGVPDAFLSQQGAFVSVLCNGSLPDWSCRVADLSRDQQAQLEEAVVQYLYAGLEHMAIQLFDRARVREIFRRVDELKSLEK